jgi:hypothetical protein
VKRDAVAAHLSVNEYCVRRLRTPGPPLALHDHAQALTARAADLLTNRLVGVVLHGSFVRGEARQTSDIDALVVVDASVPLTRSLCTHPRGVVHWGVRPLQ